MTKNKKNPIYDMFCSELIVQEDDIVETGRDIPKRVQMNKTYQCDVNMCLYSTWYSDDLLSCT